MILLFEVIELEYNDNGVGCAESFFLISFDAFQYIIFMESCYFGNAISKIPSIQSILSQTFNIGCKYWR